MAARPVAPLHFPVAVWPSSSMSDGSMGGSPSMADSNEAGMTLLEVIVALAILSLGLAGLFNIIGLGTGTARRPTPEPLDPPATAPSLVQGHTVRLNGSWPEPLKPRSITFDTLVLT